MWWMFWRRDSGFVERELLPDEFNCGVGRGKLWMFKSMGKE